MGTLIIRTKVDGTTVKEWESAPVLDADGNIVWENERLSIPVMDKAPEGMLD